MSANTLKGYIKDQGWILFVILLCLFADSELILTWTQLFKGRLALTQG